LLSVSIAIGHRTLDDPPVPMILDYRWGYLTFIRFEVIDRRQ
jgi:hypothetical protein